MAVTSHGPIVTSRFDDDRAHTLERYLETGGYDALRKALSSESTGP